MNESDIFTWWSILTTIAFFGIIWLIPTLDSFWIRISKETSIMLSKLSKLEKESRENDDIFGDEKYKECKRKLEAIEDLCSEKLRRHKLCYFFLLRIVPTLAFGSTFFFGIISLIIILIWKISCYNFYLDCLPYLALFICFALLSPLCVSVYYLARYKPAISSTIVIKHLRDHNLYPTESLSYGNRLIRKRRYRR